jgi:hypothetical protein
MSNKRKSRQSEEENDEENTGNISAFSSVFSSSSASDIFTDIFNEENVVDAEYFEGEENVEDLEEEGDIGKELNPDGKITYSLDIKKIPDFPKSTFTSEWKTIDQQANLRTKKKLFRNLMGVLAGTRTQEKLQGSKSGKKQADLEYGTFVNFVGLQEESCMGLISTKIDLFDNPSELGKTLPNHIIEFLTNELPNEEPAYSVKVQYQKHHPEKSKQDVKNYFIGKALYSLLGYCKSEVKALNLWYEKPPSGDSNNLDALLRVRRFAFYKDRLDKLVKNKKNTLAATFDPLDVFKEPFDFSYFPASWLVFVYLGDPSNDTQKEFEDFRSVKVTKLSLKDLEDGNHSKTNRRAIRGNGDNESDNNSTNGSTASKEMVVVHKIQSETQSIGFKHFEFLGSELYTKHLPPEMVAKHAETMRLMAARLLDDTFKMVSEEANTADNFITPRRQLTSTTGNGLPPRDSSLLVKRNANSANPRPTSGSTSSASPSLAFSRSSSPSL